MIFSNEKSYVRSKELIFQQVISSKEVSKSLSNYNTYIYIYMYIYVIYIYIYIYVFGVGTSRGGEVTPRNEVSVCPATYLISEMW